MVLPLMLMLDAIWIGGIARNYYKSELGALLAPQVTWWAAGLLYVLYAAAFVFFVLQPALAAHSFFRAVLSGLFLGLTAFAVYDLTNLATTAGWPLTMSFVDMAWGAVQGALISGAVFLLFTSFNF